MFPINVTWAEAAIPRFMVVPKELRPQPSFYRTSDFGNLPERLLVELGLPLKYAVPDFLWANFNRIAERWSGKAPLIGTLYFPDMSVGGLTYPASALYAGCRAFRDNFESVEEMVHVLRGESS